MLSPFKWIEQTRKLVPPKSTAKNVPVSRPDGVAVTMMRDQLILFGHFFRKTENSPYDGIIAIASPLWLSPNSR